jgi:hypothetical protein
MQHVISVPICGGTANASRCCSLIQRYHDLFRGSTTSLVSLRFFLELAQSFQAVQEISVEADAS